MVKVAILASGNGSNFDSLVTSSHTSNSSFKVCLLICDNPKAFVLERAKRLKTPFIIVDGRDNKKILDILLEYEIEIVLLAGYMRILKGEILEKFENRILNIHPSYLPEFPGRDGIGDAYRACAPSTGVTVHIVDSGIDSGKILYQEKIDIPYPIELEALKEIVHLREHAVYYKVVNEYIRGNYW